MQKKHSRRIECIQKGALTSKVEHGIYHSQESSDNPAIFDSVESLPHSSDGSGLAYCDLTPFSTRTVLT